MSKKTVLITGAAGGIGEMLCKEFSDEGYKVIATDKDSSSETVCDSFIQFDLEDLSHSSSKANAFVDKVNDELINNKLNALVNNAALQVLGRTGDISREDWLRTLDVNLTAPFLLVQLLLNNLEKCSGSVINISSVHANATKPGFVSYATSKAALVGLTQALAVDLGGGVRVNAISPAATATEMLLAGFEGDIKAYDRLQEMHPIGRIAKPSEVAKVAVFLASESASFITGTCVQVDGGISVRLHDPE